MFHGKFLMLLAFIVLAGCGPRPQATGRAEKTPPDEIVKTTLEQLAETGQVGSEAAMMINALEEMKAAGSDKAEALLESANQLLAAPEPEAVKAKAKQMLATLEGTAQESPSEETAPEEGEAKDAAPEQ